MKIVLTPNKVLTGQAKPVGKIDNKIRQIIKEMKKVLFESEIGVGLAAPQVGLPYRLFIAAPDLVNYKKRKKAKYYVFINPEIVPVKENKQAAGTSSGGPTLEGCLSIPNIWGKVARKEKATLTYLDEFGKKWTKTFTGLLAIIIQHEMDHLRGVLFTHHVCSQGHKLYKQVLDRKSGKYVMEEVEI